MKGKTTRNIFLFLLAVGILICIAGLAMANFDPACKRAVPSPSKAFRRRRR